MKGITLPQEDPVISGPNNLPDLNLAIPAVQATTRRTTVDALSKAQPAPVQPLVQVPDSVQLSPLAQSASRVAAAALTAPDIRPTSVNEALVKILSQTSNSSEVNAKLAEKLLTGN
jgi:hypothetical protein